VDDDDFFREFEHTGDTGIEVFASSRAELFARSVIAMGRLMVAPDAIEPREHRSLEIAAAADDDLMHDALSAALSLFVGDGFVWRGVSAEERDGGLILKLTGEPFDRRRHQLLTELKAVTYHQLKVSQADGAWTARIIFDV
jgi:SHS2 domain-containing protein